MSNVVFKVYNQVCQTLVPPAQHRCQVTNATTGNILKENTTIDIQNLNREDHQQCAGRVSSLSSLPGDPEAKTSVCYIINF
jgi:hypothetical protein